MVYIENCAYPPQFFEHIAVAVAVVGAVAFGAVAFGAVCFYVFSIFRLVDLDGRIRGDLASCLC